MLDTGPVFCHNHEKWSLPTWLAKFRSIGVAWPPWLPTITAGTGAQVQGLPGETITTQCPECPSTAPHQNKGGPWKMADDGAMVVYRGVDNQSEEMIHQDDRRSDKSVTVAGLTWTEREEGEGRSDHYSSHQVQFTNWKYTREEEEAK